jgi:hypothetical protein
MVKSRRYSLMMSTKLPLTPNRLHEAGGNALLRTGLALTLGLLSLILTAGSASASPAEYNGISADGSIVVFSSDEPLVSGDTDHDRDVYLRSYDDTLERYVTREVSSGPTGGNDALPAQYDAISADGNLVFFSTKEPLTTADTDSGTDIYMRNLSTNTTTLVSQGADSCEAQGCGDGSFDADFVPGGLTPSGDELFFVTDEQLAPLVDTDSSPDIYMRQIPAVGAAKTILVSQAAADCESCGNGAFTLSFNAVSPDGSTVVFSSSEQLADADEDALQDVYVRDLIGEATRLVSTPRLSGCPGTVDCKAVFGGVSNTGSHIFFESREQISSEDLDESQDVYDWSASTGAVLSSIGPDLGNSDFEVTYKGSRSDGSAVFFLTSERLDSTADTDDKQDVYERFGSTTTLVSTGPMGGNGLFNATLNWTSPDGSHSGVLFSTEEQLTTQDEDSSLDVYERNGGVTTLISPGGSAGSSASFAGASSDGSHIFFITSESLVAKDKDMSPDIYEQVGSITNLVSTGPEGGNGQFGSGLNGVSVDGLHAFLTTTERLTPEDPDAEVDIYDRADSETRLVSVGNLASLGPVAPTLTATNPASPGATTTPTIIGQAEPNTWIKLYKTFDCSGEPTAQGTSAELAGSGLSVSVAEGSTTSFRATAEVSGLVSPCSASIPYKQGIPAPPPPPPGEETTTGGGTSTSGSGTPGGTRTGTGDGKGGSTITYVMPETLITFGPAAKTRKRKIIFGFTDATGQPGSSFTCKLDHRRWKGCSSPTRFRKLKLGRHIFSVKAINALGTADERPTRRRFRVVR